MTNEKEKIISQAWRQFALKTIELDNSPRNSHGYHWLIAINYMYKHLHKFPNFDLEQIQKTLPDNHIFKKTKVTLDDASKELIDALRELTAQLKNPNTINKIFFSNLQFDESVNFSNFIFPVDVIFSESTFSAPAYFQGTVFSARVDCNNTTFSDYVNFSNSQFCSLTYFQNTVFCKFTNFSTVIFFETANFYKATFNQVVYFTGTIFSNIVTFRDVKFLGSTTDFKNTKFSNTTYFKNAEFFGITYFHNAKFLKYTTFAETQFENYAPQFYGAEINDEMTWTGIKLPRFKKSHDKEPSKNYKERIESNQNAYENLSTKLGNQNKYHDEHFFFRHETRCRQELEENILSLWAYRFYEHFSDYGYGVGRAIATWFVHIIIGGFILFCIRSANQPNVSLDDFGCSLGISLSNSHAFFFKGDRLKDCYKTFEYLPAFNVIWGVQTITGTLLIFLVLLTLRVRFRLK